MRRHWWYIFGSVNGKPICMCKYTSESEANNAANNVDDWDNDDWVVREYMTEQLSVAKQMRKAELGQQTGKLGVSMQPIRGRKTSDKREDEILV